MPFLLEDERETAVRDQVSRAERAQRSSRGRQFTAAVDARHGEVGDLDEDCVSSRSRMTTNAYAFNQGRKSR